MVTPCSEAKVGRELRVHRVFLARLAAADVTLSGREAHHLVHVLRVAPGAAIKAFDGQGLEATGRVKAVSAAQVTLELDPARPSETEPSLSVHLAIGLLKGDKLADVVRKCTELGVSSIQPFTSQHGDVKAASPHKLERLRRVAQEAAKQSGRSLVPEVLDPIKLSALTLPHLSLTAHPYASATLNDILTDSPAETVTLITGPEGGLSGKEIEMLVDKGTQTLQLGPRILRAETAPIALLAALLVPAGL